MTQTLEVDLIATFASWHSPHEQVEIAEMLQAGDTSRVRWLNLQPAGAEIDPKYPKVGTVKLFLTLETTREEAVQAAISQLKEREQQILAEAEVKAKSLRDQIQSLLAIEHKPKDSTQLNESARQSEADDDIPF